MARRHDGVGVRDGEKHHMQREDSWHARLPQPTTQANVEINGSNNTPINPSSCDEQ
jgi:hypothetical protein